MKTMLAIGLLMLLFAVLFAYAAITGFMAGSPHWFSPAGHASLDLVAGGFILWRILKRREGKPVQQEDQP